MRLWLRWKVAILLDHVPGQCWADLVDWVQRHKTGVPWFPNGACRGPDLARCGSCYCGKLRRDGPR